MRLYSVSKREGGRWNSIGAYTAKDAVRLVAQSEFGADAQAAVVGNPLASGGCTVAGVAGHFSASPETMSDFYGRTDY